VLDRGGDYLFALKANRPAMLAEVAAFLAAPPAPLESFVTIDAEHGRVENRARPNWLTAWALRVAGRRGKKRATVALARRIGLVLHRMWRDGTEFRFTREEAMAASA
jgi:hypothetical protein